MNRNLSNEIEQVCRFCSRPDPDRILYETQNFYVMLSLGPIVEGYTLVCSKDHIDSCGMIPETLGKEFDALIDKVKSVLNMVYGGCIMFEHGRAGSCLSFTDGSKHCYHAHMHLVPVAIDINSQIGDLFPNCVHSTLAEFRAHCRRTGESYLFVDDGIAKSHTIGETAIRRQYLRHLVAKSVGKEELWDWVRFQRTGTIRNAVNRLTPYFSSQNSPLQMV